MALASTPSFGFSGPQNPALGARVLPRLPAGLLRPAIPQSWIEPTPAKTLAGGAASAKDAGELAAQRRLIQRATMGWTRAEAARAEELGYNRYLNRLLNYRFYDDSELETLLQSAFPTLSMSAAQLFQNYQGEPFQIAVELWYATLLRAVYSPRQLFERMVVFWTDHFNIDFFAAGGVEFLKPVDDREVIRKHALGNFLELLRASAHSPAMLTYLTNNSNTKEHPNENYARELMELHTLGADRGYTEVDVREVARCFTGWRVAYRSDGEALGEFIFDESQHDFGRKVVLGREIAAGGGQRDGQRVLRILADHPLTADFVCRKLLRFFIRYDPGQGLVDQVASVFRSSDGDIQAVVREVLKRGRIERSEPKLKRPFHLAVSSLRALEARIESPQFTLDSLFAAGHLPFTWRPPNGFPDSEGYWSGYITPRWNFSAVLPHQQQSGVDVSQGPFLRPELNAGQLARRLDILLLDETMSQPTRAELRMFLERRPIDEGRVREAMGLALASPDFQRY